MSQVKTGKSKGGKALIFLCLGMLSFVFLAIAPCNGQEMEIESVIPAYSVAYVAVGDISGIWDAMKQSPSWQAIALSLGERGQLEGMQSVIDEAKELGIDLQMLMENFGARIALVQVYLEISDLVPPAVIIEVGNSKSAAEVIQKIEQKLEGDERYEVRSPAGTYQTVSFDSVRRTGEDFTIRYAFLDNLFVIAYDQETFEAILDVYLGDDPSLLYDPKYNKTRAEIPEAKEVFVYANMELLWPIVWILSRTDLSIFLQIAGIDEIKSVAWTTNLAEPDRNQQTYFYIGESRRLVTLLLAEHNSLLSPHIIPASNSHIFLAMNLDDLTVAWDMLSDSARDAIGEEGYAQMQGGITRFEQDMSLNLKEDLLSSLNGEIGFALPGSGYAIFGPDYFFSKDLMLFFGVKDRERCARFLEKLLVEEDESVQPIEYKGTEIYSISSMGGGYMFAGDLLVTGNIKNLQSIIDQAPPLVVSEEFAEINSQLPQSPGLMYYVDLAQLGRMLLGPDADQAEGDTADLKALGSIGRAIVYDGEGLKSETVSTSAESWLETLGTLISIFIQSLP